MLVIMKEWSEVDTIYQIYPRSFKDTNRDGVGDLRGIIEKLDYLKGGEQSLGVDAIWLSPFSPSPMKDFGYDVKDYCDVDPLFGTMDDAEELIAEAHERDIAVMMDFVPNHTSDEHPWFIDALASPKSDKRDYYIFRDPLPDGSPPNNWLSVFGKSAWEYHEPTKQYYLHSFLKAQPDLNWENPAVQEEMKNVLRFWFDKGVDGVRADAVRWMGKNTELLDDPINDAFHPEQDPYHAVKHIYSRYSPELDSYLRMMTSVAREYPGTIIIFEDHLDTLSPTEDQVRRIYSIDPEISAPFNFQPMHTEFSARDFSNMVNTYQEYLPEGARPFYCFSNHDESRLATRFGDKQARMLAVLQFSLPGTPVMYYGQEIGMTDGDISPNQVQDPFEKRVPGKGLGRDPERTPMQWGPEGGFTEPDVDSWLPTSDTQREVNVKIQQTDPKSSLKLYQRMLSLRTEHETLRDGTYEHGHTDDDLFMFWRVGKEDRFLTVLNFSENDTALDIPEGGTVIVSAQNVVAGQSTDAMKTIAPLDGLLIRYPA
jgi:alpha-glucosidase